MNPFHFLLLALATWRVSSLLVNEKGPLDIFERLRTLAGIEHTQVGDSPEYYKAVSDTFFAQVLDCVWCCSVWVGIGWSILYYFSPTVSMWIALPLAISTTAIVVNRFSGNG